MSPASPPPDPSIVPELVVVTSVIEACGAQLLAASAQIDDLGTFTARGAHLPDWSGEAANAYRSDLSPLGRRADSMSLALRGVARRVQAHADRMSELRRTHDDLDGLRAHLVDQIAALRQRFAGGGAGVLEFEALALTRRVQAFEGDLAAFVGDVGAEESSMRVAFDRVLRADQIEDRYGGISDPADTALATAPPVGSTPEAVAGWWSGLSPAQRLALIAAAPGAIGNLAGIPARVRSQANSVALDRDLADWGAMDPDDLTDDERTWFENARAADEARERIGAMEDPVTREPLDPQVYLYDPAAFGGDGAVAMAVGDLDSADNVAIVVPGFGTDAESAGFMADRVGRMYESSRVLDPGQSNASLFWVGYDAPDNLPWREGWDAGGVVSERMAQRGGERLADTIDGLREARTGPRAHLSVVGYSYGSTTTGSALGARGLSVDDAILVGSPGLGADNTSVEDLGVRSGHTWVGANSRDPIVRLGNEGWADLGSLGGLGLGENPAEDGFGAIRFTAETRPSANPFDAHLTYFEHDSESLENISRIVNGDYAHVEQAPPLHDPWWGAARDPESLREPG